MLHFFWSGYHLGENSYNIYEFSNFEIAKWAEYYLGKKTAFNQSNWCFGKVTENPNDILIGHPTWDDRKVEDKAKQGTLVRNWVKDNALLANENCHPNTYILMPWIPDFPIEWNLPHCESQLLTARKIFALCGEIWIEKTHQKIDDSLQFRVKDKLVHCNMCVAGHNLPVFKQKFNAIGERQILHISDLSRHKGFDITCKSIKGLDTLLHVASKSIQSVPGLLQRNIGDQLYTFNFLGEIDNNNPEFNQWVVENCDFYIHTAIMDAQATTILENSTRGLVPLVTPESGFASPHAIYLTHDPSENRKIIEWALNLPESELLGRSRLVREQVLREHNWEFIYNHIWEEIQADINFRQRKDNQK